MVVQAVVMQRSTYQEQDDSTVKANAWDALAQKIEQCVIHNYHGMEPLLPRKAQQKQNVICCVDGG